MNCSESKAHDALQKAFPLLPPIMKMFLLGVPGRVGGNGETPRRIHILALLIQSYHTPPIRTILN